MRPGRFDRLLYVEPPDQKAREEILRIRMKKMSVAPDVDVSELAAMVSGRCCLLNVAGVPLNHVPTQTEGCSGAEIVGLCQEAAMFTMRMDMNALHVSLIIFMMTWFIVNGDDPLTGTTKRIHCCSQNHTAPDYQGGNSEIYKLGGSLSQGYLLISLPLQFHKVGLKDLRPTSRDLCHL
jgi:SpoVK/Ycf46/Vps4 family AAA+-type ATPase